jgi:hypothetical protein
MGHSVGSFDLDGHLRKNEKRGVVAAGRVRYISKLMLQMGETSMKRIALAVGASLLLAACSHDVRQTVPLGAMVVPGTAPWLQVAQGPEQVEVKGLEQKLVLTPEPPLASAVQSALGKAMLPDYFTDLTIACNALDVRMKTDEEDAPGKVAMDFSLDCTINARGFVTHASYAAAPTTVVPANAGVEAYAHALPVLLEEATTQVATQLRADLAKSKGNPHH